MFYITEPAGLESRIYRVVQRDNKQKVKDLPTIGYVVAEDSTEALRELTKRFGIDSHYIPVLYKDETIAKNT